MNVKIENSWKQILQSEFEKDYFEKLAGEVRKAYLARQHPVYPPAPLIFNAFNLCPFDKVKVVILGQDPYHGAGQAHGLAFSVPKKVKIPPSLQNIYKEIISDIGGEMPNSGNLEHWAKQGVLLLNATLTVRAGEAGAHQGLGWETFTDNVIKTISDKKTNLVFMLWGNFAKSKQNLIDNNKHLILTASHPSPFSAHSGFFGCKHFSKTNEYLKSHDKKPITWLI